MNKKNPHFTHYVFTTLQTRGDGQSTRGQEEEIREEEQPYPGAQQRAGLAQEELAVLPEQGTCTSTTR